MSYNKELEEKFRNLFEKSPNIIFLLDINGIIIDVNSQFLKYFGYKKDELIGKNFHDIQRFDKENVKIFDLKYKEALQNGVLESIDLQFYDAFGEKKWFNLQGSLIEIGTDKLIQVILQNITERKITEQKLKESEDRFRNIAEQSSLGIVILQDGYLKYVNKAITDITGYSNEEISIWSQNEFLSKVFPDDLPLVMEQMRKKLEENRDHTSHYSCRIITKTNRIKWIDLHSKTIRYQGKIAIFVTMLDITEQKEAEHKLKESEEKYRLLFENMNAGFAYHEVIVDDNNKPIDYKYLEVNPGFEKLTGMKKEDLIGKTVTEAIPGTENDPADWIGRFGNVGLTGIPLTVEDYSEAFEKWYKVSGYSPKKGFFAVTFTDITERKQAEQKLKESEAKFKELFIGSPIPSYTWQKLENDFVLVDYNNAAFEYTRGNIVNFKGIRASEFYADRPDIIEDMNQCYNNKSSLKKQMKYYMGFLKEHRDLIVTYSFIPPNLVLAHARDVTEKLKIEKKLKESEERYRNLFEKAPYFIGLLNKDGILIDCNNAIHNFLSVHSKSDMIGKSYKEIFSINEKNKYLLPEFEKYVERIFKGEQLESFDFKLFRTIGGFILCHLSSNLFKIDEEEYIQILIQNVTEKRISEEKLRESERFFRSMAENIQAGLTILEDDKVIYLNNRACEIFGYPMEELMNMSGFDVATPEEKERLLSIYKNIKEGGPKLKDLEYWIITKDGERRCIHNRYAEIIRENNQVIRYVLTTNITDRKFAERKLKESEENYRRAYERENFYKDLFAHDMNNILQAITTSFDIFDLQLKKPAKIEEIKEMQKFIREQVNRGANLINNVRKFSEIEESKKVLSQIDLLKVLKNAVQTAKSNSVDRILDIIIEIEEKEILVLADEFLIDVFENILINAVKHNENIEVQIKIKLSEIRQNSSEFLKLEFIDNGKGIPDLMKQSIFTRGFRDDRSVSGLGLGLSLVRNILDNYNAKIWVENKNPNDYSQGSNFVILFPIIQ